MGGRWSKTSTPILTFLHRKGEGSEIRNVSSIRAKRLFDNIVIRSIEFFLAHLGIIHRSVIEQTRVFPYLLDSGFTMELTFPVADFSEIKMEVLRHGAMVEVIKPKNLRELIKTETENISKIY